MAILYPVLYFLLVSGTVGRRYQLVTSWKRRLLCIWFLKYCVAAGVLNRGLNIRSHHQESSLKSNTIYFQASKVKCVITKQLCVNMSICKESNGSEKCRKIEKFLDSHPDFLAQYLHRRMQNAVLNYLENNPGFLKDYIRTKAAGVEDVVDPSLASSKRSSASCKPNSRTKESKEPPKPLSRHRHNHSSNNATLSLCRSHKVLPMNVAQEPPYLETNTPSSSHVSPDVEMHACRQVMRFCTDSLVKKTCFQIAQIYIFSIFTCARAKWQACATK